MNHTLPTDPSTTAGPLAGVVVLDLSRVLAGPYATMLLADLGATVIKVESPHGDETRTWRPPESDGHSTYFQSVNRNKWSIALDLSDPEDRETAERILARADVLVENFKPDGLTRFELDFSSVHSRHPAVIYASLSGFGDEGLGAALPGYDVLVQGASGLMHVTGEAEGGPTKAGVAVCDVIAGLHLQGAVLAALYERTRSGQGQHVKADLLSSMLSGLVNQTSAAVNTGVSPHRMGNEHPSLFPYGPFATGDGQMIIACGNNGQFTRLCTALGCAEAATDPRWTQMAGRNEHRHQLRQLLEACLSSQTTDYWTDALQTAGVPCAPINDVAQSLDYAEHLGLVPRIRLTRDDGTESASIAHPVKWSRSRVSYRNAPPRLDEHRHHILNWLTAQGH
ncbi:CaiB/BaiF CoA transferase family protein [Nesterenkonia muleiensis]|uniref:CaiB/BaiF CoA transferase family protein n=1 Tax=Nesterenkonia muleiensis TaxID=2282648 RepID=UPI000E770106|nr:CoA transferase [Nesterenkonia muleiensis]